MENGIKINVALAKFCPIGIDTMEDYLEINKSPGNVSDRSDPNNS